MLRNLVLWWPKPEITSRSRDEGEGLWISKIFLLFTMVAEETQNIKNMLFLVYGRVTLDRNQRQNIRSNLTEVKC